MSGVRTDQEVSVDVLKDDVPDLSKPVRTWVRADARRTC